MTTQNRNRDRGDRGRGREREAPEFDERVIAINRVAKSTCRGLSSDDVNEAMVSAMIKLARTLDIRVVAEHVESEVVFDKVRQLGVDFVQGYAVGRPTPLQQQ